jgi:hypothetical protein
MAETYQEISERRQNLIRAWHGNSLGDAVEDADADDLEWLLERIDAAIRESPHHVSPDMAKDSMERLRRDRIFIAGELGIKRTLEKQSIDAVATTHTNWRTFSMIIAAVIAFGLLLVVLR